MKPTLEALEDRLVPSSFSYHGGSILSHPELVPVFAGPRWLEWDSARAVAFYLNNVTQDLASSGYSASLSDYGVGAGHALPARLTALTETYPGWTTDSALHRDLVRGILEGALPRPGPDTLYILFVQPGTAVGGIPGSAYHSTREAPAYHGSFLVGSTPIRYAVVSVPGGATGNVVAPGVSVSDQMTAELSHEGVEAATDADPSLLPAWYGESGEIADALAWRLYQYRGYVVQSYASINGAEVKLPEFSLL